jgi:hypothetical protein
MWRRDMKIRKGPFGYYVDEPACDVLGKPLPVQRIPSDSPLQMKFNQEGVACPLPDAFAELTVTDVTGRQLVFKGDDWNMIQVIYDKNDKNGQPRLSEVDIDPENGVWYFLSGIPIEKVGK